MTRLRRAFFSSMLLASAALACSREQPKESEAHSAPVAPSAPPSPAAASLSDRLARPAPARIVAIGDLHGDLDHARRALRLAGAIDAHDRWIGGSLMVVQTGDEIDRGDDDRAILDDVDAWRDQARASGGAFLALLGNHELMNAALDFRYVTPGGL
ncbi:MAG TPA: metallophosphoesterase, partial [Polyangiaceae bacterium]